MDAALIAQILEEDENRLEAGGGGNDGNSNRMINPSNPEPYYQAPVVERLIDTPSSHQRQGRARPNPTSLEEEFGAIGGGYAGRNRSPPHVDNFPMAAQTQSADAQLEAAILASMEGGHANLGGPLSEEEQLQRILEASKHQF